MQFTEAQQICAPCCRHPRVSGTKALSISVGRAGGLIWRATAISWERPGRQFGRWLDIAACDLFTISAQCLHYWRASQWN